MAISPPFEKLMLLARNIFSGAQAGTSQKKRRRRMALLAGLGLLAYTLFGGDQGLVSLAMSWRETFALKSEIAQLRQANTTLEAQQAALSRDRAYYEKMAREKLLLKHRGELIYRFDSHL